MFLGRKWCFGIGKKFISNRLKFCFEILQYLNFDKIKFFQFFLKNLIMFKDESFVYVFWKVCLHQSFISSLFIFITFSYKIVKWYFSSLNWIVNNYWILFYWCNVKKFGIEKMILNFFMNLCNIYFNIWQLKY